MHNRSKCCKAKVQTCARLYAIVMSISTMRVHEIVDVCTSLFESML